MNRRGKIVIGTVAVLLLLPAIRFGPHLMFDGTAIQPKGEYVSTAEGVRKRPIRFGEIDFYFFPTRVDAEEFQFDVPESRANPNGRRIRLHFVRFPSTSKNPGAPIVYLAG